MKKVLELSRCLHDVRCDESLDGALGRRETAVTQRPLGVPCHHLGVGGAVYQVALTTRGREMGERKSRRFVLLVLRRLSDDWVLGQVQERRGEGGVRAARGFATGTSGHGGRLGSLFVLLLLLYLGRSVPVDRHWVIN